MTAKQKLRDKKCGSVVNWEYDEALKENRLVDNDVVKISDAESILDEALKEQRIACADYLGDEIGNEYEEYIRDVKFLIRSTPLVTIKRGRNEI